MTPQVTSPADDQEVVIDETGQARLQIPRYERFVHFRLGYEVEIKDSSGNWLTDIVVPDDNGRAHHFYTTELFTQSDEIDQVIDSFIKRAFSIYMPDSLSHLQTGIEYFSRAYKADGRLGEAFEKAFIALAIDENTDCAGPIKKLISYMIASEVENFDIDKATELVEASLGGQPNQYLALFTMDSEAGPFTREELAIIDQTVTREDLPLDSRCIMYLCREFGLRPIQISLLKTSDFHYNPQNQQYWLNVPSVKKKIKLRRQEFKKRLLPIDLGEMIAEMIESDICKR